MANGDGHHSDFSSITGGDSYQIGRARDVTVTQREAPADESLPAELADVVHARSRAEEEHWRIGDPVPLRVRWHEAEADLFDDWDNIRRDQERPAPVELSGQFTAIRETFQATGSRRLVILGRAGAGKTVLAHRLILDLLDHRGRRGPVPVLFSLGGWNPTTTRLREWMIDRLVRDFAFLEQRDATGTPKAKALIDGDWIVPVLDGFDELPDRHHRAAIRQISQVQLPLLLTSRPKEYAEAARATQAIGRAAAIEIEDLTLTEAESYLRRSANPNLVADWKAIFAQLRTAPQQPASQNLTPALTTPLMIMLARTHYEDADESDPGELLDTARFPTSTHLQQHLLRRYVDTLYAPQRPERPTQAARPAWTPDQARHWLGYLATRLRANDTHDFTWWQLPTLLPRPTRILTTTVAFGLAVWLAIWLAVWLTDGLTDGLTYGLTAGLTTGLAVGFLNEVGFARRKAGREPERLRLYRRRRGRPQRNSKRGRLAKAASEFTTGLTFGLTAGLMYGITYPLTYGLMYWLTDGPTDGFKYGLADGFKYGLSDGLTYGLTVGVVFGIANVAISILGEGLDPHDSDPWDLLSTDRAVTLTRAISAGMTAWGLITYVGNQPDETKMYIAFTLTAGSFFGFAFVALRLALSAWGNWLLFVRLWLPLTGRLPWRPKIFLQDAHDRGILRRAGAAYQFRHAQLRDHLAENHSGKAEDQSSNR